MVWIDFSDPAATDGAGEAGPSRNQVWVAVISARRMGGLHLDRVVAAKLDIAVIASW